MILNETFGNPQGLPFAQSDIEEPPVVMIKAFEKLALQQDEKIASASQASAVPEAKTLRSSK